MEAEGMWMMFRLLRRPFPGSFVQLDLGVPILLDRNGMKDSGQVNLLRIVLG